MIRRNVKTVRERLESEEYHHIRFLTIRDAEVRLAQLLHSMATKVMISKKIVSLGPTVDNHSTV